LTSSFQDIPSSAGPGFFQTNSQRHAELGSDIAAAGLTGGGPGTPGSAGLDQYLFETKPTVLRRLASLLCDRVPPSTDRLAACGTGGVIVAAALSLESGIPFVLVDGRPEGDFQLAEGLITGECHPGERALLVEDVVADGSASLFAAGLVRAAGMTTERVLAVIDREEGAEQALRETGLRLDSLFTLAGLVQEPR